MTKKYTITLQSNTSKTVYKTIANSLDEAVKNVLAAALAPENAIISIKISK